MNAGFEVGRVEPCMRACGVWDLDSEREWFGRRSSGVPSVSRRRSLAPLVPTLHGTVGRPIGRIPLDTD